MPLKAEILEINDVPVKTILDTHLEQQSGELDILKKAWLQGRFPFYYAAAMGFSEDFKVKYIPYGTDTPKSIVIEAVNYRDIEKDLDASFYREPYTYEYLEDLNAFYMKFDAFRDFKKFEGFSEEMFAEIEAKGSQDLIIDLRDNTGGYFDLGELLVSYLTDKPFRMTGSYINKYSKPIIDYWAERYKNEGYEVVYSENGMRIDYTKGEEHYVESVATYSEDDEAERRKFNVENSFKGNVYVLIGNKTYSSGVMLAALLKDYDLATFIGEETGGTAGGYTCVSNFNMPNTNLSYSVSWQYFTRPSNVVCKRGVMPDIEVKEDLDHYFNDKDDVLEYAKEMIRNK